jgi:hypothetical protein
MPQIVRAERVNSFTNGLPAIAMASCAKALPLFEMSMVRKSPAHSYTSR